MEENKKLPSLRSSGTFLSLSKGTFLLLGGGNREETFNDVWLLKVNENEQNWEELSLSKYIQPRFGSSAVIINNNFYIHGGQNYLESKFYGDLLQMQHKDKRVEVIKNHTIYPINIETTPCERNSHSFAPNGNIIYLFGGGTSTGLLNDLWSFNTENNIWTKHEINGANIPEREMHGMVYYDGFIYIFGGRLYEEIDKNIFKINTENYSCEVIKQLPSNMCSFSYTLYKNYIILYGGTDGNVFLKDIIIYNINNGKWARSKYSPKNEIAELGGKISSMMTHDDENLLIFGGSYIQRDCNDVYIVPLKDLLDENNLTPA
jgi:hypothetical protein